MDGRAFIDMFFLLCSRVEWIGNDNDSRFQILPARAAIGRHALLRRGPAFPFSMTMIQSQKHTKERISTNNSVVGCSDGVIETMSASRNMNFLYRKKFGMIHSYIPITLKSTKTITDLLIESNDER